MKGINEWKDTLRSALKAAMRERQVHAVAALREVLSAIDNAEAADLSLAPPVQHGVIVGGVAGLGAGEVPRRSLTEQEATAIIERELQERRDAVQTYSALGRHDEANILQRQLEALEALL